jgi:hypothetical protein
LPREFFEAVGGPGGGRGTLTFSARFVFTDDVTDVPTDINGDNYLDAALNEVYYNDTFGNSNTIVLGTRGQSICRSLPSTSRRWDCVKTGTRSGWVISVLRGRQS